MASDSQQCRRSQEWDSGDSRQDVLCAVWCAEFKTLPPEMSKASPQKAHNQETAEGHRHRSYHSSWPYDIASNMA